MARWLLLLTLFLTGCAASLEATDTSNGLIGAAAPAPLPAGDVSHCGDPEHIAALERQPGGELLSASACGRFLFSDQLGAPFVLESLEAALDGAIVYQRVDPKGEVFASLGGQENDLLTGFLTAGPHTITIHARYGVSGAGPFAQLKGYHLDVKSAHAFIVGEARSFDVRAVAYPNADPAASLEARPRVRFADAGVIGGEL